MRESRDSEMQNSDSEGFCRQAGLERGQTISPRPPIRKQIVDRLIEAIVTGEIPAASRLVESDLADEYGASRTPVREALLTLESLGFVAFAPARGFAVLALSVEEVRGLYPIMGALERLGLRETPAEALLVRLAELTSINEQLEREQSVVNRLELDAKWHQLLLETCPNTHLLDLIEIHRLRIRRYEYAFMWAANNAIESASQHREIIESLRDWNLEQAGTLLEQNWVTSVDAIAECIEMPAADLMRRHA